MPSAAFIISFFQVVNIVGSALAVLKLFTTGLYRRYRIFFVYFVFRIPYMTASLILAHTKGLRGGAGTGSWAYFYVFFYSEPLLILLYVLVVVELYRLVLERYKGLYTIGRWAMYGAVVISTIVSILTALPKIGASLPEPSRRLMYELATDRGVELALVIFILLIVAFLTRYHVALSRNVVVHTAIYSVFFLSGAMALLFRTLFGFHATSSFNMVSAAISAGCALAWWRLLSSDGEEAKGNGSRMRPGSEERVLQQLDMLNATLLKASKK
jgi:hypothetical protein